MDSVTHHGRVTAYETFDRGGTGPGLLCVHGSGGTREVWKPQARLAGETPVTALDLSGHGDSEDTDAAAGAETLGAYADDVVAVVAATDARVLVGNSLGGAVALWVALERDVSLDGLVLTGTGPRLPVLDDLLSWLANDFDRAVEFLHAPDRLFHAVDADHTAASATAMRETGRGVTERDFLTSHAFDVRDRLDEVGLPALALVGEHDRLTPVSYHETLARELPRCELGVIEDAAHLAMLERPRAFCEAVSAFLDRL
ncbi:MAG: putative hydrolase or acyltransferases (alpha/beta hydrolase superfamily) [halophilic archaeon J07HB67]|jgi:Predicted hydrolases or acyltransferases (alpha/beta hydrolase superfamily)|nr:MAG: putative hydrolase or acyltransferases (alpha/beta hydrolase superfamily) [halophilic archaeon J07HB67]